METPCPAALITWEFSGTIIRKNDYKSVFTGSAGESYSGFFTYDSNAPDGNPSPLVGSYPFISFVVDSTPLHPLRVKVTNDDPFSESGDLFNVRGRGSPGTPDWAFHLRDAVWDGQNSSLSDDSLPDSNEDLVLSSFDTERMLWGGYYDPNGYDWGTVESISIQSTDAPIPEPTTIVMMGFGVLGLLGVIIRQRRKGK
jgi:hypothetical protein